MRTAITLIVLLIATPVIGEAQSAGKKQIDVCNVRGVVHTMLENNGPLKGCNPGDTAHFQVDPNRVSYSTVVARYCSLDSAVIIEKHPTKPLAAVHVVCKYHWHWARNAERTLHPDVQKNKKPLNPH